MRNSGICTIIGLFCIIPLIGLTQNNVRFTAASDARQVVLGSSFNVEFTLYDGEGSNFNPPQFQGFDVISGPNESRRISIINGQRSQSYGLSYVLQPQKIGKFTIGSASIRVNGKTYKTSPFEVEVMKGKNSSASTKEELFQELGKGVFVKAILNNEVSNVGEQIVIDYKLFTSKSIESYNVFFESDYPGFYVHDVRRFNSRQIQEVIDGVQFTTKVIKRVALFPQQSGVFEFEPLSMNIAIADGSSTQRSIFSVPKVTNFSIQTEPIKIKVDPHPLPAPPTFTGAVGKFEMRTSFNRNKLTTDDAIAVRMYITGDGDIKQVQAPELDFSEKFKVYAPRLLDESGYEEDGILKGKKVFEYQVIPLEPGEYTLSPAFTYFDTDSMKYITLTSESFPIAVSKGEIDRSQIIENQDLADKNNDIRFIKTEVSLSRNNNSFVGSGLFWFLFSFPLLLLGGVIVLRQIEAAKANIDPLERKRNIAVKVAQKRLSQAKSFLESGNSKAFYNEVSRASFGYVSDKLNIPFSELNKKNINTRMRSLEVSEESISKFMQIVNTCEMALFAGKDNTDAMKETYEQALIIIAEIEAQILS